MDPDVIRRAAMHAALGDPVRLAIIDDLAATDRSPKELSERHHVATNLLAHHLTVLEDVGLILRFPSSGDKRRKYVRSSPERLLSIGFGIPRPAGRMLFVCTRNSARSQLAAALWTARTGEPASSAGTHPAPRVHRGAVDAARRAGLDLRDAVPRLVGLVAPGSQVVTVCDGAHEELTPEPDWWHWSIADPVDTATAAAFDAAIADIDARIHSIITRTQSTLDETDEP